MAIFSYLCRVKYPWKKLALLSAGVAACCALASALYSCSSTRHVPPGQKLLDKAEIVIDAIGDSTASAKEYHDINTHELLNYLRQQPNHKVLGFAKMQLGIYNMSGNDTTRWWNRWLRRIGQAPVLYDKQLTEMSARQLRQALVNKGYLNASVSIDTVTTGKKSDRMQVLYHLQPGTAHTISTVTMECEDNDIKAILEADSAAKPRITPGMALDRTYLDSERTRITSILRDHGYYAFNKEFITFIADTLPGSMGVDLTMTVQQPRMMKAAPTPEHPDGIDPDAPAPRHRRFMIRQIRFITDYNPQKGSDGDAQCDTVMHSPQIAVVYGKDHYIRPEVLEENCFIVPGEPYNATHVDQTYAAMARLGILKFINIEMRPVGAIGHDDGEEIWMDAYVLLSRNKKQNITLELEGTNSEGDLGFGIGATYQHRNFAHGSELLTVKFRTAYESLSGNFDGLINNRYTEYAGEVGITFPKFKAPLLSRDFKRRNRASTEFALSLNYQERPEYTRVIAGAAWKYKWDKRQGGFNQRRTLDLIDINYVYLPESTINFIDQIAPTNPLLRYSYEDHFIMRLGYTFYKTNRRIPTTTLNSFVIQPSVTTFRASAEMAGNLLYAFSSMLGQSKSNGAYKIFGIQYAQYVKGEADFTYTRNFNARNALAVHAGIGIGYPYGNSSAIPFEKRFYAGGANSVRGWSARTLGPGAYDARNDVIDFINQCGDIRLDLSMEYRARLFWVFEGALFIDAGNIWTIKTYENQPGGTFKFDKFYRQIALSYGAGIRMDFTYFLLRFDLGMKAHNPAMGQEEWPLIHPRWERDATFHFAVGYPF